MKMLAKEECLEALNDLYSRWLNQEYDNAMAIEEDMITLEQLINEHFELKEKYMKLLEQWGSSVSRVESSLTRENPPLKFEDLKEWQWIWDNKEKEYIQIYNIDTETETFNEWEDLGEYGECINCGYMECEENRFYRYQLEE